MHKNAKYVKMYYNVSLLHYLPTQSTLCADYATFSSQVFFCFSLKCDVSVPHLYVRLL